MSEPVQLYVQTRAEWRAWLQANHASAKGVWLVFNKKTSGKPYLDYNEQVEEALCFGWIDSKPAKVDAERSSLYFAPRKSGSGWSRPNKERLERMVAQGLMTAAGLLVVEAAKRDGSWEKLDRVEALEIPDDLGQALDKYPNAKSNFEAFPRSVKRGILEWIVQAGKSDTRARRVEETAGLAEQNLRANQWRQSQRWISRTFVPIVWDWGPCLPKGARDPCLGVSLAG